MSEARETNRDQAVLWNEASGRTWVEMQAVLDEMMSPLEVTLVERGFPGEGRKVLDIGCGAGATTLAMARRLGPKGFCLGVDISEPLISAAKARAAVEHGGTAAFTAADAQTFAFTAGDFDAVISRFGVMFFDDPVAAFANIRRAVRPGGTLTFLAWRSPKDNPFMTLASRATASLLPGLRAPDPDAPGQFAFADGERVRRILDASGWKEVDVAAHDATSHVEERHLFDYVTKLGPVGHALRETDGATRERVIEALRAAFEPHVQNGSAGFTAACWLVRARA